MLKSPANPRLWSLHTHGLDNPSGHGNQSVAQLDLGELALSWRAAGHTWWVSAGQGTVCLQPILEGKIGPQYRCAHVALLTFPNRPLSSLNHGAQNWTSYSCVDPTDTLGVLPTPHVFIDHGTLSAFFITVPRCVLLVILLQNSNLASG